MAGSPKHRGTFAHRNLLPSGCEIVANRGEHFILLQLFGRSSFQIENPDQDLLDLIDDCERFVLRSFDGVKQSAMHIYHSALPWTPICSLIRQLHKHELMTETKLVNAITPNWDACVRIIPPAMGACLEAVVFSPSGALIAAHGGCCVKGFDAMTGANRATFDGHESISSVAFSPDNGFLVSGLVGATMNVWDVQTGTMFRTFKWNMPWSSAYSVAFSSCGTMIASGNADGTVRIWNILLGGCNCIFRGRSGAVTDVCWLTTWTQVVSASNDHTVCIWDIRNHTCSKKFAPYHDPVTALAFSRGLLLVASTKSVVIYDSQSGDIVHVIGSNDITHSCFSIDGGKVLVTSRNSGEIWDITTNTPTRAQSISYNGHHATFSPDGTRVASIYGELVKIWKTNAGHNHHEPLTYVHKKIHNVYFSPDERQVTLRSQKGVDILDATTGRSVFTCSVTDFRSIGISRDLSFFAFLEGQISTLTAEREGLYNNGKVQIWNAYTRLQKSITVDSDVFHIALSPNGSRLASLSSFYMKLWDLASRRCVACLKFGMPLGQGTQISFGVDGTSVSLLKDGGDTKDWVISAHHRDLLTMTLEDGVGTELPMVFVPTGSAEKRSNPDASVPFQLYRDDGEWILDRNGRRVLWIPPDERPQDIWNNKFGRRKQVLIKTESGKVYFVTFS